MIGGDGVGDDNDSPQSQLDILKQKFAPSGDYGQDIVTGSQLADVMLTQAGASDFLLLFTWVIAAFTIGDDPVVEGEESGCLSGVAVGFSRRIATALSDYTKMKSQQPASGLPSAPVNADDRMNLRDS